LCYQNDLIAGSVHSSPQALLCCEVPSATLKNPKGVIAHGLFGESLVCHS
jgi:hypothetical protein